MHLTLPKERAENTRVWILIPAAGDLIHSTFANCLIRLLGTLRTHGVQYQLKFLPGDSLVTRARNNLSSIFLNESSEAETDFALWLDCDILFDPESVLQMLALNLDFVAAPYSKKGVHQDRMAEAARLHWPNDRMMAVAGTPNVNWLVSQARTDFPTPVLEAGTGFWLLKRKVFTLMIDALPDIKFRRCPDEKHYGDTGYDFFRVGIWPETREYISEDWWFCREWRRLGGTVYCCFWITTNHIGPYLYPMDMPAIADLLTATNGYINGPTKEINATTQVRSVNGSNGNGHHATGSGVERAIAALLGTPFETTIESSAGPMGG